MQILKRAKGNSGDLTSFNADKKQIQEEVNRRTCKAGYTDRDGQPPLRPRNGAGKGDFYRPVNKKKYDENYERIFGKRSK